MAHSPESQHLRIALIGQPNCGKSTIFNHVAGYRSIATNFPGATVTFTESHVNIKGKTFDLVDLPGIYSLIAFDQAAEESKKYLLDKKVDVIINIVDSSILSRSLELTIELLETDIPMILCLNMMDEAQRKGISIDEDILSQTLGIPIVKTIGQKGTGIEELFDKALTLSKKKNITTGDLNFSKHVEQSIEKINHIISEKALQTFPNIKTRLCSTKILEKDPYFVNRLFPPPDSKNPEILQIENKLESDHGQPTDQIISSERHSLAMHIFEKAAVIKRPKTYFKDKVDDVLMHPFWGYVFMGVFLYVFFNLVFSFGSYIEKPIISSIDYILAYLQNNLSGHPLILQMVSGSVQGILGGTAIVLPFLLPFLIGLSIIEDIGYLPRIAYLMDTFMHKIGLHGTAVIPGMLGYGCSVPAIMATRILPSSRDRFIASVVSILIPCSARMTIIMGLVGFYLGGTAALFIYVLNIVVISLVGTILSKLLPEDIPGMILEMPAYQMPSIKVIFAKTWLRIKDFIYIAWPLLIIGSIVLSLAEWYNIDQIINLIFRPVTFVLDLPKATGTTLVFGILRKELSMLMLFQALDTTDISTVMSNIQIFTFTLFTVFYIPCVSTLGILIKEIGTKKTIFATLITIFVAMAVALSARFIYLILHI